MKDFKRCFWVDLDDQRYREYHDKEWAVPVYDDHKLFEMLSLEGAQAGLSWKTVLNKRNSYRKLFKQFNPVKVAKMKDSELDKILTDKSIIRNKAKIYSARNNAKVFNNIAKEHGSFSNYLWEFVNHIPIQNKIRSCEDLPQFSKEAQLISKDLKKRGMSFIGEKIIYGYMQAIGMVNDHEISCFRYEEVRKLGQK